MDKKHENKMSKFGLLGKNISYSFSKSFFTSKFENEHLKHSYENFDIDDISKFKSIIKNNLDLKGLNVTIPYKEEIIPFLDDIDKKAKKIGAVNTIKITSDGKLKGYNTDWYGFKKSIEPLLKPNHKKALILGTGGASKAIAYTLDQLHIDYAYVSRNANKKTQFLYADLTPKIIADHPVIINCTPIGTHPNVDKCPNIPYSGISEDHLLYDLIYNPLQTKFLTYGISKKATICNGLLMLKLQAKKAWHIWTND